MTSEGTVALQDIDEASGVIEARALVVTDASSAPALFGTTEPLEIVEKARDVANALKSVIKQQGLITNIQGKEYVQVGGWTLLGTMLGVFPVLDWMKKLDNGWEARVTAQTMNGQIVGAAEAECTTDEKMWAKRDDYALRSMAQTRATSKALRMPLGFVVTLAGFNATPAEEMVGINDDPKSSDDVRDARFEAGFGRTRHLAAEGEAIVAARQKGPKCPKHGPLNYRPAGISRESKKHYDAFYSCIKSCTEGEPRNGAPRPYNIFADQWELQQNMEQPKEGADADLDDLPHEG